MASPSQAKPGQHLTFVKLPREILNHIMDYVLLRYWRERGGSNRGVDRVRIEDVRIILFGPYHPRFKCGTSELQNPGICPLIPASACNILYAAALSQVRHTTIIAIDQQLINDNHKAPPCDKRTIEHHRIKQALRRRGILSRTWHLQLGLTIGGHDEAYKATSTLAALLNIAPRLKSLHVKVAVSSSMRFMTWTPIMRRNLGGIPKDRNSWSLEHRRTTTCLALAIGAMRQLNLKYVDISFDDFHHTQQPTRLEEIEDDQIATEMLVAGTKSGAVWRV